MRTKVVVLIMMLPLLFGVNMMAQENTNNEFILDGIKYCGDEETHTASVNGIADGYTLTEINIPEVVNGFTVTSIGTRAFAYDSIVSVSMSNSIKKIEERAFYQCKSLHSIKLSTSLESIGDRAFLDCIKLRSIIIPNSVQTIGTHAFHSCEELREVTLPNGLKVIENGLFTECKSLESIELPKTVEKIMTWAFQGCSSLKAITIPKSVIFMEKEPMLDYFQFNECYSLESIIVEEGNPVFDSRDNSNVIIETNTNKVLLGCKNSTIPEGVVSIEEYAFYQVEGLKNITFPSTLTTIGSMAFSESGLESVVIPDNVLESREAFVSCESLRSAILPDSWTAIPDRIFMFCENLDYVKFPKDVKHIGDRAFSHAAFTSFEIPSSVTSIGEEAFLTCLKLESVTIPKDITSIEERAFRSCFSLRKVISKSDNPSPISDQVFDLKGDAGYTYTIATLIVPKGCKETYKTTNGWNQFPVILEEGENYIASTGLSIVNKEITLNKGDVLTLTATVTPSNATNNSVLWRSDNFNIAEVINGKVEALKAGTTIITAHMPPNYTDTCVITVVNPITELYFLTKKATLKEGETMELVPHFKPYDTSDKSVTWSSSDNKVATVTAGMVKAVSAGTAIITAKAGNCTAECEITVKRDFKDLSGITSTKKLSNEKSYFVVQLYHSQGEPTAWAVATGGNTLKSNFDLNIIANDTDVRQHFAFVTNDEGASYYLYHTAEKKFVNKDGSLGEKPIDPVRFKEGAYDNTFMVYFDNSHYINVGGSRQMIIDGWYTPDGGNSCIIVPVADFNPKDALSQFIPVGIDTITEGINANVEVYDLTGRRATNTQHLKQGVYIVNGKKVFVK